MATAWREFRLSFMREVADEAGFRAMLQQMREEVAGTGQQHPS